MKLNRQKFKEVLSVYKDFHLVTDSEITEVMSMFDSDYPFSRAMSFADSVHLHIKVDDTATLPRSQILATRTQPESEQPGYVKFSYDGGINMIFSSIDVAIEDLIPEAPKKPKPFLDHVGIDLRSEEANVRSVFDQIPEIGKSLAWTHSAQGSKDKPVYCCHTEVQGKHWVYPQKSLRWTRPVEFAFGALKLHGSKMGCDLRPIDPAHPLANKVPACASAGASPAHYYDPKDLGKFSEMGKFATPLMDKFFEYYSAATAADGALTKREKSLIGLAIAHSKQCPYCIEAYTSQCLETGSTPEQMHEAVHVAAALGAGIDLIHGVQMQNALRARHAID